MVYSKKKGKDKKTLQMYHAIKRLRQRYQINILNEYHYRHLVNVCLEKGNEIIKQTSRVSIRSFSYNNKDIYCVFDNLRDSIVTFLTPEQVEKLTKGEFECDNPYNETLTLSGVTIIY
jgi:hypothetical protein